ncbi:J domain-containing protein [Cronbergia sp. UHCC 0137]|uniref:J domain-containing protein n=1 Tax=Cronbergia sp. UHCC 0137 TaxID=3110239 RepID=UPI002B1F118A|nr:J domain-containing protein [Cronbergia sp. UHCC 0137]MEA5620527.1 J domain-containing protein [Cronbergia sp. UHCC 0137]
MFWKIDRGLFKYDFIDHHAVLCVPLNTDPKEIRKRYLQMARRLHPDSQNFEDNTERILANAVLSKLVNPAYEILSSENTRGEYILVLSQMGKRLIQDSEVMEQLSSDLAKELAIAPNIDLLYRNAIAKIAETQLNNLDLVPQIIAEVSELNLVYLVRKAGLSFTKSSSAKNQMGVQNPPPPPPEPKQDSPAEQYIRRAQTLMEKNQFAQAKVELQDALKLEPKNSQCHSLIAMVYLRQNQLKMAKVHFDNALKLNPKDEMALAWKPKVDQVLGKQSGAANVKLSPNNGEKEPDKSGKGGLFGGLFGGKKK